MRFDYYENDDLFGMAGDVKAVVSEQYDGGDWTEVGFQYFRYYLDDEGTGYPGGVKYYLGRQAYQRLLADGFDPETPTEEQVAAYADAIAACR